MSIITFIPNCELNEKRQVMFRIGFWMYIERGKFEIKEIVCDLSD